MLISFGGALSADNRWVIKAEMIPWDNIEGDYSDLLPADIRYPTDLSLLNEAREKTESYIDILYEPLKGVIDKPRSYHRVARAEYLATAKKRKPGKKQLRKSIRKQLSYVCRNLKHIERLQGCYTESPLTIA